MLLNACKFVVTRSSRATKVTRRSPSFKSYHWQHPRQIFQTGIAGSISVKLDILTVRGSREQIAIQGLRRGLKSSGPIWPIRCLSVKSQPIDPKYDEVRQLAIRVQEQWLEWNETGDGHRKKVWGKDLIDLYGQLLKKMKEVAKSEEEFEHIGALFGVPIVENCYRLALIHAHRLEIPQAIEHLERCVQLDPTNYTHYMKYGELQHNARMYNSAVTAYTHVVNTMTSEFKKPTEKPTDVSRPAIYDSPLFNVIEYQPHKKYPHSKLAEVLFRRAISQLALYNNELALEDWKTIIGFEPNHRTAESWAWLSHLARLRGKWQQCIELSTKALEFDPELLLAYYERSVANFVLKNEAEMKRDNRNYAILAHERMWGLTNHPIQSDWAAEAAPEGGEED